MDRLTHTGVLARLDEQTAGLVTWRDLTALPCSHPHCCSVGYLLRDDSGSWRSLTSLIGHDKLKAWLDLEPDTVANRIADDAIPATLKAVVKDSLLGLLVGAVVAVAPDDRQHLEGHLRELRPRHRHADHARRLGAARSAQAAAPDAGGAGHAGDGQAVHGHVHDDRGAADPVLRARRHRRRDDGHQCAPFCAVQAWAPLARTRLSTAVGRPNLLEQA